MRAGLIGAADPCLDDGTRGVAFADLLLPGWVAAPREAVAGRNVLLLTRQPLNAALALVALDGLAASIVIGPPDLAREQLPDVVATAGIDAVVHDLASPDDLPAGVPAFPIAAEPRGEGPGRPAETTDTRWILFTSGTTGAPKMAVHDLAGLTHAIPAPIEGPRDPIVWSTFYDIRRFGGLQMLLRALTGGHGMLLAAPYEPMAAFIARIGRAGATHVAGTPSHWRAALMNPALAELTPRYVRLSGEIADQAVLDALGRTFPGAAMGHAFASTEAGVCFEVTDRLEGFPIAFLGRPGPVDMKVADGTLRVRSPRTAKQLLGEGAEPVADADGFVDTGDRVEARDGRLYFLGRASGVINVGGLKVHPEEVEAVINRCPGVRMALVKSRKNPITGEIVAAEVVPADPSLAEGEAARALRAAILEACRGALAAFKVPASVRFVADLPMTASGKVERRLA
jgi:acyl-coenzyme A synthetase/AMP-(fatty) acid ligase